MSYRTFCPVVALVVSAFAGCATAPGGGAVRFTAADSASSGASGITVNVDASRLSGDRHEVFLQQDGSRKIATKVMEKRKLSGVGEQHLPNALNITVDPF